MHDERDGPVVEVQRDQRREVAENVRELVPAQLLVVPGGRIEVVLAERLRLELHREEVMLERAREGWGLPG